MYVSNLTYLSNPLASLLASFFYTPPCFFFFEEDPSLRGSKSVFDEIATSAAGALTSSPVSPAVKKLMERVESDGVGGGDAMADGKGEIRGLGSDVGGIEVGGDEDGEEEEML